MSPSDPQSFTTRLQPPSYEILTHGSSNTKSSSSAFREIAAELSLPSLWQVRQNPCPPSARPCFPLPVPCSISPSLSHRPGVSKNVPCGACFKGKPGRSNADTTGSAGAGIIWPQPERWEVICDCRYHIQHVTRAFSTVRDRCFQSIKSRSGPSHAASTRYRPHSPSAVPLHVAPTKHHSSSPSEVLPDIAPTKYWPISPLAGPLHFLQQLRPYGGGDRRPPVHPATQSRPGEQHG